MTKTYWTHLKKYAIESPSRKGIFNDLTSKLNENSKKKKVEINQIYTIMLKIKRTPSRNNK